MAMAVLFQCLLCVKLYECHIKYAGRFLDIKEISNIPDCHDISFVFSCVQFILHFQKTKVYESQILQHNLMKEDHIQKLHKV